MKTLLLALLIGFCLQPSGIVLAQSASNPQPTRAVKGQVLTSPALPAIRIKFDKGFKYVGTQKFVLYERAQVEQYFFMDADSRKRIKRMYMIQFEGYLPGVDATYNYPVTETVALRGQTYIVNAETVPNVSVVLKQHPDSDSAHAMAFMESKGYRLGEAIRFERFVRLVDEAKRNEMIVVYIEDTGLVTAEPKLGKEFLARALKGFTILE